MTIYNQDEHVTLHHADCLAALRDMPDASVDAVVTDPPYGLSNTTPAQVAETITRWVSGDREYLPSARGFMGHEWDGFVPPVAVWDECLRVLKPGGHLLAFAGSRTQDLMGLAVRLAGFEIRDSVAWLYGSGFPKSMDVSKAIDKGGAVSRPRALEFTAWMRSTGITPKQINEAAGTATMGAHYVDTKVQPAIATAEIFDRLRPLLPEVPERIERLVAERTGIEWKDYVKRPVTGHHAAGIKAGVSGPGKGGEGKERRDIPATDAARQWEGWGTALKPAHEPIILARKPMSSTVAANVLEHGTGALNIDACRVGMSDADREAARVPMPAQHGHRYGGGRNGQTFTPAPGGRWPANVVLDESQAAELDRQSGITRSNVRKPTGKDNRGVPNTDSQMVMRLNDTTTRGVSDSGGASRFFYTVKDDKWDATSTKTTTTRTSATNATKSPGGTGSSAPAVDANGGTDPRFMYCAKAPKRERPVVNGVAHSTVKPLTLMRWLVRMVTPPDGTVLDPFAGSGTTLEAATLEGFRAIGVEREAEYLPLIQHRIDRADEAKERADETATGHLFDLDTPSHP